MTTLDDKHFNRIRGWAHMLEQSSYYHGKAVEKWDRVAEDRYWQIRQFCASRLGRALGTAKAINIYNMKKRLED